jgi:hypothetical protein
VFVIERGERLRAQGEHRFNPALAVLFGIEA